MNLQTSDNTDLQDSLVVPSMRKQKGIEKIPLRRILLQYLGN
jgi:hypothetical protein